MATGTITVRYTGNQDPRNRTGAVQSASGLPITMGDIGEVTESAYSRLVGMGHVLEIVDVDSMKQEELQEIVDQRGLIVEGSGSGGRVTKKDLTSAITDSTTESAPAAPAAEESKS